MNSGSSGANIQPSAQEFTLKVASVSFDDVFAELQTFRQENNGSLVIPVSHPSLSRIIDSLTSNYIEILVEKRWGDQMAALARYKEDNDNCHVPDDHPTLGRWIGDQRRHYKLYEERRANPLTKTRFESLKKVGIHRVPTRWDLRFEELKDFLAEHGHCDVQINYPRLGIWVLNQRFNLSEMPKERVEALDTLGFIWNQPHSRDMNRDIAWNAQYEKLKRFIRENGHPNVPKASRGLSAWVRKQRYEYNQLNKKKVSSLTRHRIEKLEMVGFQWRLRPDTIPWEERFEVSTA